MHRLTILCITVRPPYTHHRLSKTLSPWETGAYTGSPVNRGVGSAAVLIRGSGEEGVISFGKQQGAHGLRGRASRNDPDSEVVEGRRTRFISPGSGQPGAIAATGAFNSKPGHYLMGIFRKLIPDVRWTPGHHTVPSNEAADEQAKLQDLLGCETAPCWRLKI